VTSLRPEPVEVDPHDRKLLDQVGRLRVAAWAPFKNRGDSRTGCWLDAFELSARHWVIFDNSTPVAAARLSVHQALDEVPDASIFTGVFAAPPPSPIGSFNRLVVHPAYRGMGLSRPFDRIRLEAAIAQACRSAIVETHSGPKRVAQLNALGFQVFGPSRPYPGGHFSEGPGIVLFRELTSGLASGIRETANHMGWSTDVLSAVGAAFVRAAAHAPLPVLDIGAAYGVATIPALEAGATVVANDLDGRHLDELRARTPAAHQARLTTVRGRFPEDLSFAADSLGAIHCSQVLHFLRPREVIAGLELAFDWLRPGGQVFLLAASPFQATYSGFIPEFFRRKAQGDSWPGLIEPLGKYNHHWSANLNPPWLHVFDDEVLSNAVRRAGFEIDAAHLFSRDGLPEFCRLDGREHVAVIARKPSRTRSARDADV
jgi:GNAT superfamily N-acetyltransferase